MTQPSLAEALEACTQRCKKMEAPLSERQGAFAADVKALAPQFADIVERMVGRLIIITPETQKYGRQLKAESGGAFPILTDLDCGYALELQLAIKINDEKRNAMTSAGWDIAPLSG